MTRLFPFPGGTIDSFDWPGFEVTGYGGWMIYNDYQREKQLGYYAVRCSPLDNPRAMMGTGPFRFVEWIPGEGGHLTLDRYPAYWGGWPAGALGTARTGQYPIPSRGWIERYVEYHISDWTAIKLGFLAGDYDSIYVPRAYASQVWQQPGIRCKYPGRSLSVDALFFNFNVADGIPGISPFVGNEQWGDGLPLNAFSDLNFRKGFAYTVNFTMFLEQQWLYEAFQVASPHIPGLVPWDISLIAWHVAHRLNIDLVKAEYYLKLSWGGVDIRSGIPGQPVFPEDPAFVIPGLAWNLGFKFDYVYNAGNMYRGRLGDWMSLILYVMNHKFFMNVNPVDWKGMLNNTYYESANYRSIMPLCACGWSADYAHADNAFRAFMHTYGYFAHAQSYGYAAIDALIEEGAYDELNDIFIKDLPDLMGFQPLVRRWERDWVQGWYYNPLFGGSAADQVGESVDSNLYTIWKEKLPWEDIDANGKVEIKDLSYAGKAYGSYFVGRLMPWYDPATGWVNPSAPGYPNPPWGYYTATWDSRADVNQDMKVDIKDLAKMAKLFGFQAPGWP
jgi:peptide/nickel transport system substrate-binding protein